MSPIRIPTGTPGTSRGRGPDVIVGFLPDVQNYGSEDGISAFAVGTTSCNIGDEDLLWISSTNEHPVIGQNMYRLKDGRFEQIGMSWLKHGFASLNLDQCSLGCDNPGSGSLLGPGCSDPYSAGLNGSQHRLGPRFEVNAFTGEYLYPFTDPPYSGEIARRIQVKNGDLDPAQGGGGAYFIEGHYVTLDDAGSGNHFNNTSYRPIDVSGSGENWTISLTGDTQQQQAAIRAWKDTDDTVTETEVYVPGEGLFIVAAQATSLGGGQWHYEYAVQNINSDRSMGSFAVPIAGGTTVSNIGFHDVDYHSGEPFSPTDWPGGVVGNNVEWATEDHGVNANANALRWGTLYNFRFDADAPPQGAQVTLGLFKPGTPDSVVALTIGPATGLIDCNENGIADDQDIADGTSQDCNENGVPDECETFPETPLTTVRIATGLSGPVGLYSTPDDPDKLFILEQGGRIKVFEGGSVLPTPFLDVSSLISTGGERGLLGMAFDPGYGTNGHFYVNYTNASGNTVIARYTVSGDPNVADPGSAVILKTIIQDFANHNGGQLQFGPDGMLYVGMGDGGSGGDPNNRSQNPLSLLGKMLRLDVDNPPTYVPADNPFVGDGSTLDEIWALGVRNPWRFSFDRLTGDMYIGDVGQNAHEEISFQPADSPGGENYGWRCYEGDFVYNDSGCGPIEDYVFPIVDEPHSGGVCSITGGFVYRGCEIPDLSGTYFYSDWCADFIRSFRYVDGVVTDERDRTVELTPTTGTITSIVSFGEDAYGELYIVSAGGSIYKIVPDDGAPECGNGTVEDGEQCDPPDGETCDEFCQFIDPDAPGDTCASATPICPGTYTGNTNGASSDGSASCGSSSGSPDVWYTYTPVENGTLTLETCAGGDYDTVLSVHSDCPGDSGNQIVCNDDDCNGTRSRVTLSVTAGVTYRVRVSGWNGSNGDYILDVFGPDCLMVDPVCGNGDVEEGEDCDPPDGISCDENCQFIDNNACEDAVAIGDVTFDFDTTGTTTDGPDEPGACDFSGYTHVESDIWYCYTATCTGDATVSLCGSSYDTKLAVYDGCACPTEASAIACNDDFCDLQSEATFAVTAGMQYLVRVGGYQGAQGAGTMAVSCDGVPFTDCNENGVDDGVDLSQGTSQDCNANMIPDECDIEDGTSDDCDGGPVGVIAGGDVIVNTYCFGCHNTDGSGGQGFPGPNIRNKSRVELWNKLLPPTDHPGGTFPQFTEQDFADLEAYLADFGSRGRPDLVPDECQILPDCDENQVADGCDLENGTTEDLDYDGVPDICQDTCPWDVNGSGSVDPLDVGVVKTFFGCAVGTGDPDCDAADVNNSGAVDPLDVGVIKTFFGPCP